MDARFEFTIHPERNLVRVVMSGFFTPKDVARFDRERTIAYSRLKGDRNTHLTLCDVSNMTIQSQEVVASFTRIVANPRLAARRLAVVTGSSLARMQMRRVTQRDDVAFFVDVAEAEDWLFS